jgi:hypothetical protein
VSRGRRQSLASGGDARVSIEILHVPDCPLVGRVRETVRLALARVKLQADVVERIGAYPSPTLLVDGRDVTGRPQAQDQDGDSACRLDLPTEQQVLAALERLTATRHNRRQAQEKGTDRAPDDHR